MARPFARAFAVTVALLLARPVHAGEAPVADPPLRAAMKLVQDGDLERGVVALDGALRRLGPERVAERATGHLYLGMACLGLSQASRARRHLGEAWALRAGEPLDPKLFPPRVIALYEQNRRSPSPPPKPDTATPASKPPVGASDASDRVLPFVAGAAAGAGALAVLEGGDSPLPGGELTVRVFNCDDHCRVFLNGRLMAEVGVGQDTGRIDLAGRLADSGANVIAFDVSNAHGGISYGFEVRAGEAIVFQQLCGVAVRLGCEDDKPFPPGIARRYEYVLAPR